MKQIAIFLAEGFEEIEGLTVVDILRRAGIAIDMVSITGSVKVTGSHGIEITADKTISATDFTKLDMIVLPGGMPGTENLYAHKGLESCEALMKQVDAFAKEEKYLAAICAAPSIYGHRGLLSGKRACCYPGFESHLTGAKVTAAEVSVDGHMITSRGMGTAIPFALAIVEAFCGKEKAEELSKSIIYKA